MTSAVACGGTATAAAAPSPRPDHVVIAVEGNRDFSNVIGDQEAPCINELAGRGALFVPSYALVHPSQPNCLMPFAGSGFGVTGNGVPQVLPFSAPNLDAELIAAGGLERKASAARESKGVRR